MDDLEVAAALLSALLHAGWNAAVKTCRDPPRAMTAQMVVSSVASIPVLAWTGLPAPASWPWLAVAVVLNIATVTALLRAYALGGFGATYPVVRAVAVLLVAPIAALAAGERIGPAALGGVVVVAASLAVLARDSARSRTIGLPALGWTVAAGAGTALMVLCDAKGVRASGSPLAYGFMVAVANGAAMTLWRRREGPPWRGMAGLWGVASGAAAAAMASYLLILWALSRAPMAPAAALRDTSAVFAILISVAVLREPFTRARLAAVCLAAAAVPLIRLG